MKYSMCSAHDLCNSLSHTKFIRTHTTHTTVTSLIQTYQKYRFAFYITYTHIIHSLHTYTSHTEEGGVKKPNSNHSNIIYWNQNQSHWFHIHLSTLLLLFFFSLVSSLNLTIFFFWFFFYSFFFLFIPATLNLITRNYPEFYVIENQNKACDNYIVSYICVVFAFGNGKIFQTGEGNWCVLCVSILLLCFKYILMVMVKCWDRGEGVVCVK